MIPGIDLGPPHASHAHTHIRMNTDHAYPNVHTRTHEHIHVHIHMNTHMHTHMYTQR